MDRQHHSAIRMGHSRQHNDSQPRLQGAWLVAARVAWVALTLLAFGLFVAALPSYFAYLHTITPHGGLPQLTPGDARELQRLGLSLDFYAWLSISVSLIILLVYDLVGIVLFWRKSDDRMALLASLSLVLFPITFNTSILGSLPAAWTVPSECVEFLGNVCLGFFFYLFPSGQFVPRWTGLLLIGWTVDWASSDFFPNSPFNNSIPAFLLFLVVVASALVLQVYRYRRISTPLQRQQTKWVVFGIALGFGVFLLAGTVLFLLLPLFSPISPLATALVQLLFDFFVLLFPLSVGLAILRSRLWEIDTLINRALVYGSLTVLLAALYVGLVIGLESLVGLVGGRGSQQPVVLVVSTLVIYALFRPVRNRLQRIIDRRFYRRKYDAARTLAAFSTILRNEVDLATLSDHLVAIVQETMQPTSVSLWLRPSAPLEAQHASWSTTLAGSSEKEARKEGR